MMIYLRQQWEHNKRDQYQLHNGNLKQALHLINQKQMKMKVFNEELWEDQSFEEYYSTHESEEASQPSDLEDEENEVSKPDIYVTRSGRRSKPPERLIYDANACLIRTNEHEDEETWSEQHLLAFKASTDPDTMYHHQAMKQPDKKKIPGSYEERM